MTCIEIGFIPLLKRVALGAALFLFAAVASKAQPAASLAVKLGEWTASVVAEIGLADQTAPDRLVPRLRLSHGKTGEERGIDARALNGEPARSITVLRAVAERQSFLVAFDGLPELWEISTDPNAEPIYDGFVHDWRMKEGIEKPGRLTPRRTPFPAAAKVKRVEASSAVFDGWIVIRHDSSSDCSSVALVQLDARRWVQAKTVAGLAEVDHAKPTDRHRAALPSLELLVRDTKGHATLAMLDVNSRDESRKDCTRP